MKHTWFSKIKGFIEAIIRYPFTTFFLIVAALVNFYSIEMENSHTTIIFSCFVGGVLSASMQALWERFFSSLKERIGGMVITAIVTLGYYFLIETVAEFGIEIKVRTAVTLLALFFAFILLPVMKSEYTFHQNFMAIFKGALQSILYAGVLFLGCTLIISAVNLLIVKVDEKIFIHSANVIFVLFAPIFFLSMVPRYLGKKRQEDIDDIQKEKIVHAIACPKFLEILLSYIVIPIVGIYTIVLILYIVLNIRAKFWSNNLLEPLFVSYAIAVIVVFLLVSELKNRFVRFYIRVFPKVLIPIVVFQMIASFLTSFDTRITFTRYYVILFGIFAAISGIIMSIFQTKRNGYIVVVLIVCCIVSVIPPMDAFTTSRNSQIQMLESTLKKNNMLIDNKIVARDEEAVSEQDRRKITMALDYLYGTDDLDRLKWLPNDFSLYEDFYDTFGFAQYRDVIYGDTNQFVSYRMEQLMNISEYNQFIEAIIEQNEDNREYKFEQDGETYYLKIQMKEELLTLTNAEGNVLVTYDLNNLFYDLDSYKMKEQLSSEDATITIEQNSITITFVIKEMYKESTISEGFYADMYIFIRFE